MSSLFAYYVGDVMTFVSINWVVYLLLLNPAKYYVYIFQWHIFLYVFSHDNKSYRNIEFFIL